MRNILQSLLESEMKLEQRELGLLQQMQKWLEEKLPDCILIRNLIMTGNLDQLSEEELESRMKQILDDNKLITVEPSPSSESHQEEKHYDQKTPHHPDRMN